MKKIIMALVFVTILTSALKSQITLENTYTNGTVKLANLSQAGYKYYLLGPTNNQISIYNINHSIYKTINITAPSGYQFQGEISDNLFNSDSLIEIIVVYYKQTPPYNNYCNVFNENNVSIINIGRCSGYSIFNVSGNYKLRCSRNPSINDTSLVYALPGTLPCDACGGLVNVIKNIPNTTSLPNAYPNPTSAEITIPYRFTNSETKGKIKIYDITGKIIKEFNVDNTFENLILNTHDFSAGTYYYNLITSNGVSDAKKIIVIK